MHDIEVECLICPSIFREPITSFYLRVGNYSTLRGFFFAGSQSFDRNINVQFQMPPTIVNRKPQISGRIKYEMQKRGKTILIFRNGDEYTRAIAVLLKHSEQKSMDLVLKAVGEKVILPTSLPIRRLFTMDGEPLTDAEQLEDNKSYVASGQEAFIQCLYGQALPNIICGSKKAERIRYLNSVTTPMPGKQRNKIKSNVTDSVTPRTSRQITNDNKTPKNKMDQTISKPIKSIPKAKIHDELNNNDEYEASQNRHNNKEDNDKHTTLTNGNNQMTSRKPIKFTPVSKDKQEPSQEKKYETKENGKLEDNVPQTTRSARQEDPQERHSLNEDVENDVENEDTMERYDYGQDMPYEDDKQEDENLEYHERGDDLDDETTDYIIRQSNINEEMEDNGQHAAAVIQAGYRGYKQRSNVVID